VAQNPAGGPAKLGKVSFPISCNATAQKEFAERVIEQTAAADSTRPEITQARHVLGR
jgi:hypothetical protein